MNDQPPFESALTEIEQILRALEDGTTTLEESLTRYERGVALLQICYGHLQKAESRIALLAGVDGEGKPVLKPFDHTASELTPREGKRSSGPANGKDRSGLY
jgi:exodeoxyribonuclease VII small subunit